MSRLLRKKRDKITKTVLGIPCLTAVFLYTCTKDRYSLQS